MDASNENILKAKAFFCRNTVIIIQAFITTENVLSLLTNAELPKKLDLLVIDIDGNDYYVMNRLLSKFQPRVIVTEFNASLGPTANWSIAYDPEFHWNNTAYFGVSLKALEKLGSKHGYSLVGCDSAGVNAFFVRQELAKCDLFPYPRTSWFHFSCPTYGTKGNYGHSVI